KKAEYISVDLSSVKLYVSENEKYMTFDYKNEHGKKSAVFYLNNGASINSLELLNNFMDYFMKNNKFLKIKTFKLNFEADNEEFSSSFFKPKVMLDVTYDITLTSKEDTNKGYSTIKLESSVSESSEVDAVIKTFEQIYNSYHALQELRSRTIN
ncbi:MAG: hypothetical protein N3E37_01150, partial [Candidatus Micrarchaeota archaeon]|nr:hypothetical protein [Candidatus Micrarchaeota archaeon]